MGFFFSHFASEFYKMTENDLTFSTKTLGKIEKILFVFAYKPKNCASNNCEND